MRERELEREREREKERERERERVDCLSRNRKIEARGPFDVPLKGS